MQNQLLDSLLAAANMPAKPVYSVSNDLPAILNIPCRKVLSLVREGRIPCFELTRKRRVVTHEGLATAVQSFFRANIQAANDEVVS